MKGVRGLKTAPPHFTQTDISILRLCRGNGWSLREWFALDEREQLEWLAYDYWRQDAVARMLKQMHTKNGLIDVSAYVQLILQSI